MISGEMSLPLDKDDVLLLPRFTIITATYNVVGVLQGLIESIREQTYENLQWIIVDGASSDGTMDLLVSANDVVYHWMSEPDQGIYDAWNKGLKIADGDWILFLGADDRLAGADVLATVAKILGTLPSSTYWAYGRVDQLGVKGRSQVLGESWTKARASFGHMMAVPHPGVFHRRALFDRCGQFDPGFKIAGDYALLLKAIRQALDPVFLPLVVTHMGGTGVSSQFRHTLLALRENVVARRSLGFCPLYPPRWCWNYLKALVKSGIGIIFGEHLLRRVVNLYRRATGRPAF